MPEPKRITVRIEQNRITKGIYVLNPISEEPDLACFDGTSFDQSGSTMYLSKAAGNIFVKPPVLKPFQVKKAGVNRWAVRLADPWALAVNKAVHLNNPYQDVLAGPFLSMASKWMRENITTSRTGFPGAMWAWAHFSAIPDNHIGLDIRVANRLLDAIYRANGTEIPPEIKLSHQRGLLLENSEMIVVRHPATGVLGSDPMRVSVVQALAPSIGVTAKTAALRGGDFDHDLAFLGVGCGERVDLKTVMNQIEANFAEGRMTLQLKPATVRLMPIKKEYSLQSVFFNGHFDKEDTGFWTLVGGEAKAKVGLFKSGIYWTFEGLLVSVLSDDQINDLAVKVIGSELVDPDSKEAITQYHNIWDNDRTNLKHRGSLVRALVYGTLFPLEELIMDGVKRKVDPDTLETLPEAKVDPALFISGLTGDGSLPCALEEVGIEGCVAYVAMQYSWFVSRNRHGALEAQYSPRKRLEEVNPDYSALLAKNRWGNHLDLTERMLNASNNMDSVMNPAPVFVEVFGEAMPQITGNTTGDSLRPDPYPVKSMGDIPSVTDVVDLPVKVVMLAEVTTGLSDRYSKLIPTESVPDAVALGVVRPDGRLEPIDYFTIEKKLDLSGKLRVNILKSSRGSSTIMGGRVFDPEMLIPEKGDSVWGYLGSGIRKATFMEWLSVKASDRYMATFKMSGNVEFAMKAAAEAARKEIFKYPRVPSDLGAAYLGSMVWVEIPKEAVGTAPARRLWTTMEALGYDPRTTPHANRGERLGRRLPSGNSVLAGMIGFGQVTNYNRLSKMDSGVPKHRKFVNAGQLSTPTEIDANSIDPNTFKDVCVLLVNDPKLFGDKPADETYRTPYGDETIETAGFEWEEVEEEAFWEWYDSEEDEAVREMALDKSISIRVSQDLEVPSFHIPVEKPGITREQRKLILGIRPGVSQPIGLRLVASFRDLTPEERFSWAFMTESKGTDRVFKIDVVDNWAAVLKKEAGDQLLRMANSQLDEPFDPRGMSPSEIVSSARSAKAYRSYKGLEEPVQVGEFDDLVSKIEKRLVTEGKDPSGRMFIWRVDKDGQLVPLLDKDGDQVRELCGFTIALRPCYEDGWGSYGKVDRAGIPLDPHQKALIHEDLSLSDSQRKYLAYLKANLKVIKSLPTGNRGA